MQAETGKTPDETPAGVSALAPARQPVSSKFIRREGARASDDDHAKVIAQRFSILRTRLLREMRDRGWRKLAVAPLTRGAGATFVTVNLALALARQKHTQVMLLDMDLARPAIASTLGIPGCDSVSATLASGGAIGTLIRLVEEAPNLSVLAPGRAEPDASEILQDRGLAQALESLVEAMPAEGIALMDTGPLLAEDEALATLPMADAILLVADGRRNTAANMAEAQRLLTGMPPVLGLILNKSED
ncbi:chromosome partitioning protein [Paracoccus yeei]|uniref:chromosome partitioning protein n=1 Tax=Paracoccus yeei TaxID=147645 RepID=UPI0028D24610|nr:chromosome partitioning protein [Paracoccus yeei]